MYILGLNAFHGDSSACILKDGELIAAAEEERFRRIKHWAGIPIESIQLCLKENSLEFKDIINITVNTNPTSNINQKLIYFLKNYLFGEKKFEIFNQFSESLSIVEISNMIKNISKKFDLKVLIKNIKNPRTENENHKLRMVNSKFLKVLKRKPKKIS